MTTILQPGDPTKPFSATYDAWNRLVKIEDADVTVAEYEYDGATRRTIKKTYSGGVLDQTRHFFSTKPSQWQVVEERVDSSTDPENQFAWGMRYVDDLLLRDRDTTGDSTLNERLYGMEDANWNVTGLVDTTGSVQERYAYTAYGGPIFLSPNFTGRTNSSFANSYTFAGRRLDAETGLFYFRARYYDSRLGTFVGRDPIGSFDSLNLCEFLSSNPVRYLDPSGEAATFGILAMLVAITCGTACAAFLASKAGWLPPGRICEPIALVICGACVMGVCIPILGVGKCIVIVSLAGLVTA
jgi:RHS repeat-associated protein